MTDVNAQPEIIVAREASDLAERAASLFLEQAGNPSSPSGMFTVALSGGSTPRALYQILAQPPYPEQLRWDSTQVFFSDERFVPPDSAESNFRMANEALLSRVPIPERFVHRVPTEGLSPNEAAATYEEGLRRVLQVGEGEVPSLDLILLGLGEDGHTASLFPDTDALTVTERLVVANHVPALDTWRISFTYPLINAARCVLFLVSGVSKASIAAKVLAGGDFPAARVHPTNGRLVWLMDEAAAAELPEGSRTG